jgi:hypothetical protein
MRSRPKITRIQFNDHSFNEYTFLGIVSNEADYKLSSILNSKLRISLKNNRTIDIPGSVRVSASFSRYSDTSHAPGITYDLISNRSEKEYLIKKLKKIDYFFQIHGQDIKFDIEQLTATLREIERITAVFKLDPLEIKDKNLIYLTL